MLEYVALGVIFILVPELIFGAMILKAGRGFKFRFSVGNLNPFIRFLTVAVVILLIAFITPIIEFLTTRPITNWLLALGFSRLLVLTIGLILFALAFLTYFVLGKKPDKAAAVFVISLIILAGIYILL